MPEDVVEAGLDTPGAEGVEEDGAGAGGFVEVELVEERVARMGGIHEAGELGAEDFDLGIG
jgi:hypothetical protein